MSITMDTLRVAARTDDQRLHMQGADQLAADVRRPGLFDFADRSFVAEVRSHAETIAADRAAWHIPPAETLFVQRKVSGTAMLAVRMESRLPLRDMVAAALG